MRVGPDEKQDGSPTSVMDNNSLIDRTRKRLFALRTTPAIGKGPEQRFQKFTSYVQNNLKIVQHQQYNKEDKLSSPPSLSSPLVDNSSFFNKTKKNNDNAPSSEGKQRLMEATQRLAERTRGIRLFASQRENNNNDNNVTPTFRSFSDFEKSLLWTQNGPPCHFASTTESLETFVAATTRCRANHLSFITTPIPPATAFSAFVEDVINTASNMSVDDGVTNGVDNNNISDRNYDIHNTNNEKTIMENEIIKTDDDTVDENEDDSRYFAAFKIHDDKDDFEEMKTPFDDSKWKWTDVGPPPHWASPSRDSSVRINPTRSAIQDAVLGMSERTKIVLQENKLLNMQVMPIIQKMKINFHENDDDSPQMVSL